MMIARTKVLALAVFSLLAPHAQTTAQECTGDANRHGEVTVGELVLAVDNALQGCGLVPGQVSISGSVAGTDTGPYRGWAVNEAGEVRDGHPDMQHHGDHGYMGR